jgi:hypothetical protein
MELGIRIHCCPGKSLIIDANAYPALALEEHTNRRPLFRINSSASFEMPCFSVSFVVMLTNATAEMLLVLNYSL